MAGEPEGQGLPRRADEEALDPIRADDHMADARLISEAQVGHAPAVLDEGKAAIAHRKIDDDEKLIIVAPGISMTDKKIMDAIWFQEQYLDTEIVRSGSSNGGASLRSAGGCRNRSVSTIWESVFH